MSRRGHLAARILTRAIRRYLVGSEQHWAFQPPPTGWKPSEISRTSMYIHLPFCRHFCPYCPYTKVPYHQDLVEPFTRAAMSEIDWWADATGHPRITSIYIGGGTPTLAMDSVGKILEHVRSRFRLTGDICIETNPGDVDGEVVKRLEDTGVSLVSLGVQSFREKNLALIGRDYGPAEAERALSLLASSGFESVNADIMFALPDQNAPELLEDLARAVHLGADQVTAYPLFTFPYTAVGEHLRLSSLRMPRLRDRRTQYRSLSRWLGANGFQRVSVWGFKREAVPRYSSVTRDGYIGIGPGAGSHLPGCFVLNTFDFQSWSKTAASARSPVAMHLPFTGGMSGWWWLYWRLYDTRIPLGEMERVFRGGSEKADRLLHLLERNGFAAVNGNCLELTDRGSFWLHLAQNYFALNYVNTIWTQARLEPWPGEIHF